MPAEEQVEDLGAQGWDLFAPSRSRRGGREVGQVLAEEGEELAMGLGADELSVQCALHGLWSFAKSGLRKLRFFGGIRHLLIFLREMRIGESASRQNARDAS